MINVYLFLLGTFVAWVSFLGGLSLMEAMVLSLVGLILAKFGWWIEERNRRMRGF
jgi:hypothetical protein